MHTLYESDFFSVTHMMAEASDDRAEPDTAAADPSAIKAPTLVRHGFEIVDKSSGKEVYLDGSWAEMFQLRVAEWQRNAPTEEEVEDTLAQFAGLAQTPVCVH